MRIYNNFTEAFNEIQRDLAELGTLVQPETMQDKDVADDANYLTRELSPYMYQVLKPDQRKIPNVHIEWVLQEWADRLSGELNPGQSWKVRRELWVDLMEFRGTDNRHGEFSYTYSERMGGRHIERLIDELKDHPHSRQLWLPVWWPIDETRRGVRRVPCSLGYWVVQRQGKIDITYMMRSCDFITHMPNDVALAVMLMKHVAHNTGFEPGRFTHFIGSLHVYQKDVKGTF